MDKVKKEIAELEKEISHSDFWAEPEKARVISQRYENLKSDLASWENLKNEVDELGELAQMDDSGLSEEIGKKLSKLIQEFKELEFLVLFSGRYDEGSVVVSIHAGTGGVDAQDWAQMLRRLYLRFCERHNFEAKVVDETPGAEAGLKSATIEISGRWAYGWLKSENGVHRLVRISPFDAEKMRHTSFALVEVLPESEGIKEIELKDEDLKIEVMRASGHGGQSVNTTDSAVRITHLPTGLAAKCQNERSQLQNKKSAIRILKAKLLKYYETEEGERVKVMKGDYQKAEWGNQARSYVLNPYKLVKDHRTEHETADVDRVLNGEIDDFVESYLRGKIKE